jgi:glycosyltransferase involved in cell wall biosynthesis
MEEVNKMSQDVAGSINKIRVLLLSSSTHPFVEELRNQLSKNGIGASVIYLRGLRAIRFNLIVDALLFWSRLCIKNPSIFFKLVNIMFKSGLKVRYYLKTINIFFMGVLLYKLYLRYSYDLIHAFWSYPAGVAAVLVKTVTGARVVISVLGYDVEEGTLKNNFLRELSKFALENADAIIVAVENHYINIARMGVSRRNVYFIPIGIDTTKFRTDIDGRIIRKKYEINDNDVVIAFGPHLRDLYGPIDFLKAAAMVSKEVPNAVFVLMGDGYLSDYLKELAGRWKLKAIFTGQVPYHEMPLYYAAADIFCTPSYAGQGVSTLEAMASGKPVVGYKIGTIRIEDDITGFLVPKGDIEKLAEKLTILVKDQNLRKAMGENARRKVQLQYDIALCAQRIMRVYQKILSARTPLSRGQR